MLLHSDSDGGGTVLAAQVSEFASPLAARSWRHRARRELPAVPGLVFAKAMFFIGSRASAGFGGGVPALGRQVLLTAWRDPGECDRFFEQPLAADLGTERPGCWSARFDVVSTRGSHLGSRPLRGAEATSEGRFAALTLGRVRPRSLPRFLREGARLGPFTERAPGLLTAVSAGWPVTGNCTLSIWESETEMLSFAFADDEGHGRTIRRDPPILAEQLNARLRLRHFEAGERLFGPGRGVRS